MGRKVQVPSTTGVASRQISSQINKTKKLSKEIGILHKNFFYDNRSFFIEEN